MKTILSAALIAAIMTSAPAFAAKQGALSHGKSTGKIDITTVVPTLVKISGLTDVKMRITPDQLTSPYQSFTEVDQQFCVYSNNGAEGGYTITTNGTPGANGGPFGLTGANGSLDYAVWVSDNAANVFEGNGKGYSFPGATHANYETNRDGLGRRTSLDCDGGAKNDASLGVRVDNAAALAAVAGTYKGQLTLVVAAQ